MENKVRAAGRLARRPAGSPRRFVASKLLRYSANALILLVAIHCLLFPDGLFAQEKKAANEATVITSKTLTTDNKAKTAIFEGDVIAKKGDIKIFSDRMAVFYSDEKGGSNIKKIDAEGNVKLLKENRVITSKFATYFSEPVEKIVFTGEPKASEGENVVTGTKMIYLVKDDVSIVENSKVFLKERK